MDSDDAITGGDEEFARQLRRLQPAGHTIDRDTLMFRAGQRSAGRRLRLWQSLAGATVLLTASLGWLNRPTQEPLPERGLQSASHEPPQERGLQSAESHTAVGTVLRAKARAPQRSMAVGHGLGAKAAPSERVLPVGRDCVEPSLRNRPLAAAYLELRRRVAFEGMDALPTPGWAPLPPATVQTIADWLRLPSDTLSASDPLESSGAVTKGNPS